MTTDLDERLSGFTAFLRQSLNADRADVRTVIAVSGVGSATSVEARSGFVRFAADLFVPLLSSISLLAVGASTVQLEKRRRVLAAPIGSDEFERHFVGEVAIVRALIKEVTLGTSR
jgi:hypothetical protein